MRACSPCSRHWTTASPSARRAISTSRSSLGISIITPAGRSCSTPSSKAAPALSRSAVDRDAAVRDDPAALDAAWADARVLVVEDSVGVRELERVILEGAGYQVDTAVDGLDGASRLREDPADLVADLRAGLDRALA